MGSRIMHLIIANQIAEQFSIQDRTSFLLGGIAPDAASSKEQSHFYTGDINDYSRSIDFVEFLHKYDSYKYSNYILGYYTHLVADDLWLKGFYLAWLKNRMDNNQSILEQYHQDFRLLNGKLLNHYGLTSYLMKTLQHEGSALDLDEVTIGNLYQFIPFVLEDMNFDPKYLDEPLTVFTFDQIVGYIETSIDKGIKHIHSLMRQSDVC
ncbi:zinc dependent phospholipase C family protein [Heyndrickxia sp. NPDC080065]|uniref:zinc dependent phospholipase C family protein n=1 Tax=Heyndrickxia sp. NPDC080065 TaxID=3390568 RepID=UPI003D08E3D3